MTRTISLVGCLVLVGVISFPSLAAIKLSASRPLQARPIQVTTYLSDSNQSLKKALFIHNTLNEMSELRETVRTSENMKKQGDIFKDMQGNFTSCHVKKLGKVFKNPEKVWAKMKNTYAQKRQTAQKKVENQNQDKLTMSLHQRQQIEMLGWDINRDIMMDVYANPQNWGEVNAGESFPLWQDQIALFEKEWKQFYENLNLAYGVPLEGRPAVDEATRHNPEKYNAVVAAHKAYVAEIGKGRRPVNPNAVKGQPPKAPKPLPKWQEIVRIDSITGKAVPELPEPWQKMSNNKFENYVEGGEMSRVFSGKSMTPTAEGLIVGKGDLETEYEMDLALDATNKSVAKIATTQQEMLRPFIEKLNELGLDTTDFDLSNRAQYIRLQKQLKDLKKVAIEEAYAYVERLEKQDKENPDYVARREQLQAKKRARLSKEAQGLSETLQFSQVSPVVQQRLVLGALEKDDGASVYLTETNAMNIDQLMREQKSTAKIIAESHQQVTSTMDKQREFLPQMAECHF